MYELWQLIHHCSAWAVMYELWQLINCQAWALTVYELWQLINCTPEDYSVWVVTNHTLLLRLSSSYFTTHTSRSGLWVYISQLIYHAQACMFVVVTTHYITLRLSVIYELSQLIHYCSGLAVMYELSQLIHYAQAYSLYFSTSCIRLRLTVWNFTTAYITLRLTVYELSQLIHCTHQAYISWVVTTHTSLLRLSEIYELSQLIYHCSGWAVMYELWQLIHHCSAWAVYILQLVHHAQACSLYYTSVCLSAQAMQLWNITTAYLTTLMAWSCEISQLIYHAEAYSSWVVTTHKLQAWGLQCVSCHNS